LDTEGEYNATIQPLTTAKTSVCAFKQGSKTHSSSPSQRTIYNCKIRLQQCLVHYVQTAIEQRRCAAGF